MFDNKYKELELTGAKSPMKLGTVGAASGTVWGKLKGCIVEA